MGDSIQVYLGSDKPKCCFVAKTYTFNFALAHKTIYFWVFLATAQGSRLFCRFRCLHCVTPSFGIVCGEEIKLAACISSLNLKLPLTHLCSRTAQLILLRSHRPHGAVFSPSRQLSADVQKNPRSTALPSIKRALRHSWRLAGERGRVFGGCRARYRPQKPSKV